MTQHLFTNFRYHVDTAPIKNAHTVIVSFDYNGQLVRRIIIVHDRAGVNYVNEAKKIIEREIENGKLAKYSKKYLRRGKPALAPILIAAFAAVSLALAGLLTYHYLTGGSSSGPSSNNFIVSFDTKGGDSIAPITVESGKTIAADKKPTATREGYVSTDSWFYGDNKTPFVFGDSGTVVTANMNLYCEWSKDTFTATFNPNGGTWKTAGHGNSLTIPTKFGEIPNLNDEVTNGGHDFLGWKWQHEDKSGTGLIPMIKGGETYTAIWSDEKLYNVNFVAEGATYIDPIVRPYNSTINVSDEPIPTKDKFEFRGWFTEPDGGGKQFIFDDGSGSTNPSRVVGDTILYANWLAIKNVTYTFKISEADQAYVRWNPPAGSSKDALYSIKKRQNIGERVYPETYEDEDGIQYDLKASSDRQIIGWKDESDENGAIYDGSLLHNVVKTSTITFVAVVGDAGANIHNIHFKSNGAIIYSEVVEDGGKAIEPIKQPPSPVPGYKFGYWYNDTGLTPPDPDRFDFNTEITKDYTLNAHFVSATYTVSFVVDPDDTDELHYVVPITVDEYNTPIPVSQAPRDPTWEFHEFKGWFFINPEGKPQQFFFYSLLISGTKVLSDMTVYAEWDEITEATITFESDEQQHAYWYCAETGDSLYIIEEHFDIGSLVENPDPTVYTDEDGNTYVLKVNDPMIMVTGWMDTETWITYSLPLPGVTKDATYQAVIDYTPATTVDVTFISTTDYGDGLEDYVFLVEHIMPGECAIEPKNEPVDDLYMKDFVGWGTTEFVDFDEPYTPFDFSKPITEDTYIYAHFNTSQSVTVSFYDQNGVIVDGYESEPIAIGHDINSYAPDIPCWTVAGSRTGAVGWYYNGEDGEEIEVTTITEDINGENLYPIAGHVTIGFTIDCKATDSDKQFTIGNEKIITANYDWNQHIMFQFDGDVFPEEIWFSLINCDGTASFRGDDYYDPDTGCIEFSIVDDGLDHFDYQTLRSIQISVREHSK